MMTLAGAPLTTLNGAIHFTGKIIFISLNDLSIIKKQTLSFRSNYVKCKSISPTIYDSIS